MPVQVIAAVPTPFATDGRVDSAGARRLFTSLLTPDEGPGLDGLLIAGTTGEFPALLDDERLSLARIALGIAGPERVIVHIGSASAHQAVPMAKAAVAGGVTRVAAITPYYLTVDPARLVDYYRAVTEAVPGTEVFAYFFPECTGYEVGPSVYASIAALPGIVGAKLSGGASLRVAEYEAAAPGTTLLVGNDSNVAAAVTVGASGSITSLAAAFPGVTRAVARHLDAGTTGSEEGLAAQAALVRAAGLTPGVGPTKAVLAARGIIGPTTRMPVPLPDADATAVLTRLAAELG